MTTRKKPPVKPRPTRNSRIKSEGNEQDYRNENISYPGYDCEGKYEPPDSNYTQVQKKRDNQNIGVNREDLPVRLPEPFKKQTNVTREATTTDSKTRPVRHDPRPKSMPNAKTELIADLNKVLKGREISTEENRKNLQIPSLQRSQEIGLHVKFNERKHPSQQSDVIEKYTPEQSGVFGKYTPEQSQKHTREQPHVFEKHPSKQSDVFEKYTPDQPDVFGKKYTPEQSEKHTLGQSEVSEKHPSEQSDVFEKYTPEQPDVLIKKNTPEQSEKHNLGQPQVSEKHPSEQSDVLEKYTPEQPDDFRKYTPEQFEKPTRGQCQVFEKHPSEQSDVFEKHPLEQPGVFRKYTPGQHHFFEKNTPARSDDFEKHIRWQTQVFEKHPPEQSDVFEKLPPEQPVIPIKPLAHGVHTMEPITHYQRQQAQKIFADTEGQQTEDNLTEFSRECRYFLDHVKWLHENVKETREKYENDEMLRVVLYTKEQKMFWHLGDIEYALNSFTAHLEKVMEDYVKIVKLVNEWLKENYFEAFEYYYLNSDIQQSLVSHVKENRPIFHQVLQEKQSKTQQINGNYSFEDLEARFEEPKKWYHILNYHLRRLDDAHKQCFSVNTVKFNVIQFETMKLLEEKQTNMMEKKKQHADHPSTIITALESINPFDNRSEYAPEDIYPPDYYTHRHRMSYGMLLPRRHSSFELQTQHQCNIEQLSESFEFRIDSAYPDGMYEDPYSHITDNTGAGCVANVKNNQEKLPLRKRLFGTKSFLRRRSSPNLPIVTRVDTQADIDESSFLPHLTGAVQRDTESTADVFKETVDFVSNSLDDLRNVDSRYVKNSALDPKNGILQEGEYRRLFERIQGVINYLSRLLDDLNNCDQNDFQICQLLLDAVADDDFKVLKDYRVNSRFQDYTLLYLRKRRLAFQQIEKRLETLDESHSSNSRKLLALDVLLKQPCYFIFKFKLLFKRLQNVIEKTSDPEANVVRLVHDLVRNMNTISDGCEDQALELEEKEEMHVSKILLRIEFESDKDISNEENDISNESWAETWDDVIVFTSKKADSKDWKKVGLDVKLVTFERLVMFIDVNRQQTDEQNYVYKLIDCANKNFVEVEKPSSGTYPFKVPMKKGMPLNVFLAVMYKGPSGKTKRMYYVCWENSRLRSFEFWRKNMTVPTGDDGSGYASWSRPKYKIVKEFIAKERGELRVNIEDEVEIIEEKADWVIAENLSDNRQGWIPRNCLGNAISTIFSQGDDIRRRRRVQTDGHSQHSFIVKKGLKQPPRK